MGSTANERQLSVDSGTSEKRYSWVEDLHVSQRVEDLLNMDELVAFHKHAVLYEVCASRVENGWLGRLKAVARGRPLICWLSSPTYSSLMASFGEAVKGGYCYWKPDEKPGQMVPLLIDYEVQGGRLRKVSQC